MHGEQDPDLKALRDRREWLDAMERARGGVSSKAYASARAESKSPFRLVRLLTFGGLGAGAGIGLAIIISRLITALKGRRYLKDSRGLETSRNTCALRLHSVLSEHTALSGTKQGDRCRLGVCNLSGMPLCASLMRRFWLNVKHQLLSLFQGARERRTSQRRC